MSDSPAKKLDFTSANKENSNLDVAIPVAGIPLDFEVKTGDAPTESHLKPEEANELLLQENSQRFVLFPIQHHEVSFPNFSRTRLNST
jgi:ribonucleoside-diphosphate reductase subunit M2